MIPALLALPAVAAAALLPPAPGWAWAVLAVVALGIPHGALDVEVGRTLLRQRLPRTWFWVFSTPYLLLVALVLLAWRVAPEGIRPARAAALS